MDWSYVILVVVIVGFVAIGNRKTIKRRLLKGSPTKQDGGTRKERDAS